MSTRRWHWSLTLAVPLAVIVILVLGYRLSAPGGRPAAGTGAPMAPGDVLQVGALPVT